MIWNALNHSHDSLPIHCHHCLADLKWCALTTDSSTLNPHASNRSVVQVLQLTCARGWCSAASRTNCCHPLKFKDTLHEMIRPTRRWFAFPLDFSDLYTLPPCPCSSRFTTSKPTNANKGIQLHACLFYGITVDQWPVCSERERMWNLWRRWGSSWWWRGSAGTSQQWECYALPSESVLYTWTRRQKATYGSHCEVQSAWISVGIKDWINNEKWLNFSRKKYRDSAIVEAWPVPPGSEQGITYLDHLP